MTRVAPVLALLAVGACDTTVDLIVEAGPYATTAPGAQLVVDVVTDGTVQRRETLVFDERVQVLFPDQFIAGGVYAVLAFADLDGDLICEPETEPAWRFTYQATHDEDLVWIVDAETLRDSTACTWYGTDPVSPTFP